MKVISPDQPHIETEAPGEMHADLPEQPVVVIEPSRIWSPVHLRDLWDYRELLYFLIWRDLKVRYKQTALGAAWAILQPLTTMLIYTYFFGKLARVPVEDIPYPVFFYSGSLLWAFFANSMTSAANSLVGNTSLITKVYFPRLLIPAASIGAGLVDLSIASLLLVGLLIYYGFGATWMMLLAPAIMLLMALLALAFGIWFAALNVRYRDVRHGLPFVIQLWMFLSPIIYPATMVPAEWRRFLALNPLVGLIESFRAILFHRAVPWGELGYAVVFALVLLVFAVFQFRRMERRFAEYI